MLNNILNRLRINRCVGFFSKAFFCSVFQLGRIVYSGKVLCVSFFLWLSKNCREYANFNKWVYLTSTITFSCCGTKSENAILTPAIFESAGVTCHHFVKLGVFEQIAALGMLRWCLGDQQLWQSRKSDSQTVFILSPDNTNFCLWNHFVSLRQRFNKVWEKFLKDFVPYWHDSSTPLLQI